MGLNSDYGTDAMQDVIYQKGNPVLLRHQTQYYQYNMLNINKRLKIIPLSTSFNDLLVRLPITL